VWALSQRGKRFDLMKLLSSINRSALLGALAFFGATLGQAGIVYETEKEFLTTGDFNGDGKLDTAIVDKATGRVRFGYRVSEDYFSMPDWRSGGVKDATGVAVGRLLDEKRDSFALVAADANQISLLDAPSPTVPTDPVNIPGTALGPNTVAIVDVGGAGNTPLPDLYVASIYNDNPANRITLFRNDGKTFTQLSELPATGTETHANRLALKTGGPEYVVTISSGEKGNRLQAEKLESGKPEEVLSIGDLPAGVDYVAGNFRGAPLKDFVFYTSGESELRVSSVEEAGAGKFKASALKTLSLARPIKQLVTVEGEKKSRLLAIFGTNEPAELLEFDAVNAPVPVQQLWGTTNKCLSAAVALPDTLVLFSWIYSPIIAGSRPVTHYQIYSLKDGSFAPGAYGALATLDDRDDSTVPMIAERIVAKSTEKSASDMKPYTNAIPGTDVPYEMVPIPAGEYVMGSPDGEQGHKPDESPQHRVKISPFWMGRYEVTWDQYLLFMYPDDEKNQREKHDHDAGVDALSDAVTRPSKPYVDMSFGMGKSGYPAISMTQHAANKFCHWLSAKTGHFYRLPTEAEWEYACRAGTTTAYSFGDDPLVITNYAWFFDNSNSKYQKVGKKKPNPWGLYDMHGNVTEWVLDQYDPDYYKACADKGVVENPWNKATKPYPHSARGGSWDDDPPALRSANRLGSERSWKRTDPQLPKGKWYFTDAQFIGFRIVRPLAVPSPEEMQKYWISGVEKE
jgi:formylglycine-generating enzyme required for sulfatase activity